VAQEVHDVRAARLSTRTDQLGRPRQLVERLVPDLANVIRVGPPPTDAGIGAVDPLEPPVDDGEGGEITERVAVVTFTGGPLPAEFRDTFTIGFQAPDTPGEMVFFKTVQTCEQGETAWIEKWNGEGEEPEHPAPAFMLVEGETGHGGEDEHATEETEPAELDAEGETAAAQDGDGGSDSGTSTIMSVIALIAGLGGLALGGSALVIARRRA
jgi:hypothetical protein